MAPTSYAMSQCQIQAASLARGYTAQPTPPTPSKSARGNAIQLSEPTARVRLPEQRGGGRKKSCREVLPAASRRAQTMLRESVFLSIGDTTVGIDRRTSSSSTRWTPNLFRASLRPVWSESATAQLTALKVVVHAMLLVGTLPPSYLDLAVQVTIPEVLSLEGCGEHSHPPKYYYKHG